MARARSDADAAASQEGAVPKDGAANQGGAVQQSAQRFRDAAQEYNQGYDQPLAGYATAMGVFATGCVAAAVAVRLSGRDFPDRYRIDDLVLGSLAVHKLSRIVSKEAVASPLRMPFTRFTGNAAAAELQEEVRVSGLRRSFGELLTCPFCLAPWLSSAYVAGIAATPRAARAFAAVFSMVFVSDVLQHGYDQLKESS